MDADKLAAMEIENAQLKATIDRLKRELARANELHERAASELWDLQTAVINFKEGRKDDP